MEVADAIRVTFVTWEDFDFFFETSAGFFLFLVGTGSSLSKQSAAMRLVTFTYLTYDERRFVLISCRGTRAGGATLPPSIMSGITAEGRGRPSPEPVSLSVSSPKNLPLP
jgi:hypothetical protein